jgi:hypothetical protein
MRTSYVTCTCTLKIYINNDQSKLSGKSITTQIALFILNVGAVLVAKIC